jgi:hypothetical protein
MLIIIFLSNYNKVRIIALYIQHRGGVPDEDRRRLYQHARLTLPEQDAVNALVHLGIRIARVSPISTERSLHIELEHVLGSERQRHQAQVEAEA